jgi:glycerol dehydrogenase
VHNGLTHLPASHGTLHGEKVAYGILTQLRLEEIVQGNQLAATARQQLLKFYTEIGLPKSLYNLGLGNISIIDLQHAADFACSPQSDIHHLPFPVEPSQLMAAMISTMAPMNDKSVELSVLSSELEGSTQHLKYSLRERDADTTQPFPNEVQA